MNTEKLIPILEAELRRTLHEPELKILKLTKINAANLNFQQLGNAFAKGKYGELTVENYLGFNPVRVSVLRHGAPQDLEIVVKGHPPGMFTENVYPQLLKQCDIHLSQPIAQTFIHREFEHLFVNEYYHYEIQHGAPAYLQHCPRYYGRYWDPDSNETFVFIELIKNLSHLNSLHEAEHWDAALFEAAIKGICNLHLPFYQQPELIKRYATDIVGPFGSADFYRSSELWEKLLCQFKKNHPELVDDAFYRQHLAMIQDIPNWYQIVDHSPKTIIHGDYNPRNIGFRQINNQWSVVVLDWECVRWDVPQYDLAQFLLYVSTPQNIVAMSRHYVEFARVHFENISGLRMDKEQWQLGFWAAIKSHLLDRAPLLGLVFDVYPGAKVNLGTLIYQNAKALIRNNLAL